MAGKFNYVITTIHIMEHWLTELISRRGCTKSVGLHTCSGQEAVPHETLRNCRRILPNYCDQYEMTVAASPNRIKTEVVYHQLYSVENG